MERAIKGLVDGRYAWIVFTSVNAVRAVWEKFDEHGLDARALRRREDRLHRRGDRRRGARVRHPAGAGARPASSPREGLLAEFSPHDEILDPVGRVLLPRADIATETLAAGLTERGWEVDDVTAYRTVRAAPPPAEIRDAIKSGGFDAVLLHLVLDRAQPGRHRRQAARPTVVAVIGPKTAETAARVRPAGRRPAGARRRCPTWSRRWPRTPSSCARSWPRCRPSSAAARRCRARRALVDVAR